MSIDLARELEVARQLARQAATLVHRFAGQHLRVQHKSDGEPVTQADLEASALIVGRLTEEFPDDAVLSEERPDDGSRLHNPRVWFIDPVDGTRDFIRGEDGYVVMIGLCLEGKPMLGVVAQPSSGLLWSGVVGVGAWCEHLDGTRVPVHTSTLAEPPGVRLVVSKSHRSPKIDAFRQALGISDEANVGSVGLKVSMVSQGDRDLYLYPGEHTKLWDTCGPEAILVAAGGRMTDNHGRPLVYTEPELGNLHGVVASNGPLHDHVIRALAMVRAMRR